MRDLTNSNSSEETDRVTAQIRYPQCTICALPIDATDTTSDGNEWMHAACGDELDPIGLVAENARLKSALRRIGLPQIKVTQIGFCADGHHEAVLIARRTLELCR
jgi:hypothetical protein